MRGTVDVKVEFSQRKIIDFGINKEILEQKYALQNKKER